MKCPKCHAAGRVIDSRETLEYTRRRHECNNGHRFTTNEVYVPGTLTQGPAPVGMPLVPRWQKAGA